MNMHRPLTPAEKVKKSGGVHPLDHIDAHFLCDRLTIFTPTAEQIATLMDRARADLPVRLASNETVRRVAAHNPDCFWAVARRGPRDEGQATPRGLIAFLMLNEEGADALITGKLDARDPPTQYLVAQHQRPAAIYGWLMHARGTLAPGLTLVMEKLQAPLYRGADIFCRAASKDGAAFFDSLGFSRGLWWDGEFREGFRHYRRTHEGAGTSALASRFRPPFDDYMPGASAAPGPVVRTKVVHTLDEMMKVFAIRSAVYLDGQNCPYDEEFDGNDFSGTHLLGSIDGEPAGSLRIRYFADFAKIERVAVLSRFRHRGLARKLVVAAIELCRAKGYRRVYAHARRSLLPFWERQGFTLLPSTSPFAFSDYEYVEIIRELVPAGNALALEAGPYVLVRPEGQWDVPGILERSAMRGVTPEEARQ